VTIVTHTSPDFDAIGAAWLLKRYGGLADHPVAFVNTGAPDPELLSESTAVVDTGRVYDPRTLRFDHHQLPGAEASATSAALQVYQWLILHDPAVDWNYLTPLVMLIYAGDTGRREWGADWSRTTGIHALLSAYKATSTSDQDVFDYGCHLLDLLAGHLWQRDQARRTLDEHTVYRSDDGLLVALRDAPEGASSAAHEAGARLVVFADYQRNAIGVWRAGEWQEPHCGHLVELLIVDGGVNADVIGEADTWYLHQAGFFAGRGTAKAPREDPIRVDVVDVARAIDRSWKR
jgi:hypothetical protein